MIAEYLDAGRLRTLFRRGPLRETRNVVNQAGLCCVVCKWVSTVRCWNHRWGLYRWVKDLTLPAGMEKKMFEITSGCKIV